MQGVRQVLFYGKIDKKECYYLFIRAQVETDNIKFTGETKYIIKTVVL